MLKFDLRWGDMNRYLLQILSALFLVVADLNAVVAAPTGAGEITFYRTDTTHVAQVDDIGFTARAPPMAVSNVAATGGVSAMQGGAFVLHGHETVTVPFGFGRATIAPNRTPNLTDSGTLTNRFPDDAVVLQTTPRTLVQDSSGRYWLEGPTGNRITPSGSYDFVTLPDGTVRVARPNTNQDYSTHLGLSGGGEVSYAGSIRFGNNAGPSRGTITNWSNNSGHYTPPADLSGNAGLPAGSFTAH